MELDAPVDSQLDGIAPSSTGQPGGGKDSGKDPERFYCPYPGCNRSFAELWRLKVHFRAPPDIRGSGKERGHGTELTHCPKCGKTLKPGKHHVGCSGSKTSARQANKRSRAAGEAEPPDDALTTSPPAKQVKSDLDLEPLPSSWQDYARSHGAQALHPMTLQPPLKQEQQDWPPAIQPGIIYGPNGTATACWLPAQVNGFVPQLSAQGYAQPHYPTELQFNGSAHGYPQQAPAFPSLQGYSQPGLSGLQEPGQVLSLPPNGTPQQLAGMSGGPPGTVQPGAVPGVNPVLFHQQTHDASTLPSVHIDHHGQHASAPVSQLVPAQSQGHSQPQQNNDTSRDGQQLAGRAPGSSGHGGDAGNRGSDGEGAPAPAPGPGVGAGGSQPIHQCPPKPTTSNDSLGSVFGDVEEFTRDFGRMPSPPPLPADFHSASFGGSGGVLFNFAQFGQKLPRSQSHTRLDRNLSAVGLSMDNSLETDLLYDHTDDGDLMQLLFGVPDELPTMATIHLHKWSNEEEEEPGSSAARPGNASAAGLGAASAAGHHLAERSSSHTAGATPQQELSQPQAPGEHTQPGINGKTELHDGPNAHSHGSGPEPYLVHGGGVGGGKAVLAQLVNGMSNQNHAGDDHHRDHLLDAETFRLLQSCD